jgi:hypothetical protein
LFGVENGQVIISASLECPGCSAAADISTTIIQGMFKEEYVSQRMSFLNDNYEQAILNADLWKYADYYWQHLTEKVQDFFGRSIAFPFLSNLFRHLFQNNSGNTSEMLPPIEVPSASEMFRNTQGLYIGTRFKSHHLCLVKVKGSRTNITILDNRIKKLKTIRIDSPKLLDLELDREARFLLEEYVSLLCNRPFLSMASTIAMMKHEPVPRYLFGGLAGSLVPIEAGATLIAYRDHLQTIDRETMREIISFSEGTTQSTFQRPDKLHVCRIPLD